MTREWHGTQVTLHAGKKHGATTTEVRRGAHPSQDGFWTGRGAWKNLWIHCPKKEVSASRLLQRIGMLVAHIKTEKKHAHVAHTQLRNSDPLPDGAFETEGRGSPDLRGDSKHIVDRVNSDSKFSGKPQGRHNGYPRTSTFFVAEWESRAFGESWQLDETRLQGSQHSKRWRMGKTPCGSAVAASAVCAKMVAVVVCGSPCTTETSGSNRAGISFR